MTTVYTLSGFQDFQPIIKDRPKKDNVELKTKVAPQVIICCTNYHDPYFHNLDAREKVKKGKGNDSAIHITSFNRSKYYTPFNEQQDNSMFDVRHNSDNGSKPKYITVELGFFRGGYIFHGRPPIKHSRNPIFAVDADR